MAELLDIWGNKFFQNRGICEDADSNTSTGCYDYSGSTSIAGTKYGRLICIYNSKFPSTWAWGVQLFFGDNNTIAYRTSIRQSGVWLAWKQLQ